MAALYPRLLPMLTAPGTEPRLSGNAAGPTVEPRAQLGEAHIRRCRWFPLRSEYASALGCRRGAAPPRHRRTRAAIVAPPGACNDRPPPDCNTGKSRSPIGDAHCLAHSVKRSLSSFARIVARSMSAVGGRLLAPPTPAAAASEPAAAAHANAVATAAGSEGGPVSGPAHRPVAAHLRSMRGGFGAARVLRSRPISGAGPGCFGVSGMLSARGRGLGVARPLRVSRGRCLGLAGAGGVGRLCAPRGRCLAGGHGGGGACRACRALGQIAAPGLSLATIGVARGSPARVAE